ncbi:MAG: DUF4157 domain-containing protein [Okeania sp. SIO2C9]|nr:DUF4157 domain-containing protein [Okeania sp. SIO2C9]
MNGKQLQVPRRPDRKPNITPVHQLKAPPRSSSLTAQVPTPNKTGLPDRLKAGVENLSGYSLDNVKVHYNSPKPAQLQAHAYAQGTNIYLASGQERHLPHETWHVVQQKQGRVNPTVQMKGNININDDPSLEREADVMGVKALSSEFSYPLAPVHEDYSSSGILSRDYLPIQRLKISDELSPQKIGYWMVGRAARGTVDEGVNAGIIFAMQRITASLDSNVIKSIVYVIELISVIEKLHSFWKTLPNEARVFVYYLYGSIVNWWYKNEASIPESIIGNGEIEESSLDSIMTKLRVIITLRDSPGKVAAWLSSSTVDWLGNWWKSKEPESMIASGFNKEAPPIPSEMQEALKKLQAQISEEQQSLSPEQEPISQDTPQAEDPQQSDAQQPPIRQIHIPPMRLVLHEMATERGTDEDQEKDIEKKTGGLVVKAGFQISLFDKQFPDDISQPIVKILMPWLWSNESLVVEQINQIEVIKGPVGLDILYLQGLSIAGLKIEDEGLQEAQLGIQQLNFGKDFLKITNLKAQWSASEGSTFEATAAFMLGDVGITSSAKIDLNKEGKLSNVSLSNFNVNNLPGPFEDFGIESASIGISNGEISIYDAELILKEGYGLKQITLKKLKIDETGKFHNVEIETKTQDIEFSDGGLKITDFKISAGISSSKGWTIEGTANLKAQIPQVTAEGKFTLKYDNDEKKLSFSVDGGNIHATPLDFMTIDATNISYKDGLMEIGEGKLEVNLPADITLKNTIKKLTVNKDGIDWETIEIGVDPFTLWNLVNLEETKATISGNSKKYETLLQSGFSVSFGDYFGFGGRGIIKYYPDSKELGIESAEATVNGGLVLPGSLLPVWPVDLQVFFPIVPGLEANGGIKIDGGVKLGLEGSVGKERQDPLWRLNGTSNNSAFIRLEINAGLTAGSGYVIGISGNLFAGVESKADAKLNLEGGFKFAKEGFDPGSSSLISYDLNAKLLADIGANIQGHALGIFHKKLYEIKFAQFELGTYTFKGKTGFSKEGKPMVTNEQPSFKGSSPGKANFPEYTIISDSELIAKLSDDNMTIWNSGDKKKEIVEEKLDELSQLVEKYIDTIDTLLEKKFEMEGNNTDEEYIKKLKLKKRFLLRKSKRKEASNNLELFKTIDDEIEKLRERFLFVDAVGITIREQDITDPQKLEENTVKMSEILKDIETQKISYQEAINNMHERLRTLGT